MANLFSRQNMFDISIELFTILIVFDLKVVFIIYLMSFGPCHSRSNEHIYFIIYDALNQW